MPPPRNQREFIIEATDISVKMTIWTILHLPHFSWHMYLTILHGFIVRWYEMLLTPMRLSNLKLLLKDLCRIWIQNKAQFAHNMAINKFKRFGKDFWEENKRHRNNVVNITKKSLSNYLASRCEKHGKRFGNTMSPLMSDKKFRNGGGINFRGAG